MLVIDLSRSFVRSFARARDPVNDRSMAHRPRASSVVLRRLPSSSVLPIVRTIVRSSSSSSVARSNARARRAIACARARVPTRSRDRSTDERFVHELVEWTVGRSERRSDRRSKFRASHGRSFDGQRVNVSSVYVDVDIYVINITPDGRAFAGAGAIDLRRLTDRRGGHVTIHELVDDVTPRQPSEGLVPRTSVRPTDRPSTTSRARRFVFPLSRSSVDDDGKRQTTSVLHERERGRRRAIDYRARAVIERDRAIARRCTERGATDERARTRTRTRLESLDGVFIARARTRGREGDGGK